MENLTVVLPSHNEAEAIGEVIKEIRASGVLCNILVVDYRSTDGTKEIARRMGATVIDEPRRGKGIAVRTGFKHANTPFVVMANSDYTYPVGKWLGVIYGLLASYDVVACYRKHKQKGSMSLLHKFGNWGLSLIASALYGRRIHDVCSGLWGFRKEALDKFELVSDGFTFEADLFANTVRNKCSMAQVPVSYRPRLGGRRPKLTVWDGFKIAWFLIKRRFA